MPSFDVAYWLLASFGAGCLSIGVVAWWLRQAELGHLIDGFELCATEHRTEARQNGLNHHDRAAALGNAAAYRDAARVLRKQLKGTIL